MPDGLLDLDAEDEPVVRRALPSGHDPWIVSGYDLGKLRAKLFTECIEEQGVEIICAIPSCDRVRKVHPMHARNTLYCSKAHRELGFRLRRKGTELPVSPPANRPWEWRNREQVRDRAGAAGVGGGEREAHQAVAV